MLWIPGPTEVRPEILAECARPMIGHRGPAMTELIERIDAELPLAFGLDGSSGARVCVHSASASGLMEAALLGAGERVLCVVNGAFSRRFLDIARGLGKDAVELALPAGSGARAEDLAAALDRDGPFDAVTLVANETSTGARTPLAPLAEVLEGHPDTHFIVDVVSLLAGAPIRFDAERIDFALAGSQKALALPPGIAVFCASERYVAAARRRERKSWYLDPVRILDGHAARRTPATPCIPLYFALARQLEDIGKGVTLPAGARAERGAAAWRARYDEHEGMRRRTLEWAAARGLAPFPEGAFLSPTVACIRAEDFDAGALVAGLARRGYEISNGYGDLKGRTFRIGHMGDHTLAGLEALLDAADDALAGLRG